MCYIMEIRITQLIGEFLKGGTGHGYMFRESIWIA